MVSREPPEEKAEEQVIEKTEVAEKEEEEEEVTRDKVEGLELATVGPSRRELTLLVGAVGCAVDLLGFSRCRQVLDPSLHVEHWLSE